MGLRGPDTGPLETERSVGRGKRGSKSIHLNLCCEHKWAQRWELQEEASQGGYFLLWGESVVDVEGRVPWRRSALR